MIHYVQIAHPDGHRWYTVAALVNVGIADWLQRALQVDGRRAARVVDDDELREISGEEAVEMAHNDLAALDAELLPTADDQNGGR